VGIGTTITRPSLESVTRRAIGQCDRGETASTQFNAHGPTHELLTAAGPKAITHDAKGQPKPDPACDSTPGSDPLATDMGNF